MIRCSQNNAHFFMFLKKRENTLGKNSTFTDKNSFGWFTKYFVHSSADLKQPLSLDW